MKKYIFILILAWAMPAAAQLQLHREPVFGLNLPAYRWNIDADRQYFGAPESGSMGIPTDAITLRFASGQDTTEIILIADGLESEIRWLRCQAGVSDRPLEHISKYGLPGDSTGYFQGLEAIVVASQGDFYEPSTDHLFAADRMNHRIVRLNFDFHPSDPLSDQIIWESETFVDTNFYPADLAYITIAGNESKILALDDISDRLMMFSDHGDLETQFDLSDPADTIFHIFSSMAVKADSNDAISIYLIDRADNSVKRYSLTSDLQLQYVSELQIDPEFPAMLTNLIYNPSLGLYVIGNHEWHIFQLAEDLSDIIRELEAVDFDSVELSDPYRMVVFPERLIVFESLEMGSEITTFAFNQPLAKRNGGSSIVIPKKFSLMQNYPNPFNPNTAIRYQLPVSSQVKLTIYDILGRRVTTLINAPQPAGEHKIVWDASAFPSGLYFARLEAGEKSRTVKMILLK
jgi:hypothetical protein